ncbi:acyl-CoA carboxylase subunit beta [Vineibacter terrae]|uniref:acyl-CoA carboxylase subunit beta n=1 Tax=Vineibacter terrae TaxID=2586908 RepID=UPI002E34FB46|nr:carboxyl transferase domain-containing protein [Vineibacter terrae]HEX2891521.1 carboxyl transferase domain-containing protein [Vineibacter terrae]
MGWDNELDEIAQRRQAAKAQGGEAAVARQHARGRLTIRERIDALLDPGSFREIGPIAGAAERADTGELAGMTPANFVLGFGKIAGRPCVAGGEDFTIAAGSPNLAGLRKSIYTEELACQYRVPLVRLHEGSGGSVTGSAGKGAPPTPPEPVYAPHRFASVGRALATVPVATAALGAVAGLPAVRLVSSHYCVMTRQTAQVLVGGPALVERALGQAASKDDLGGAAVHEKSGVIDDVVDDEAAAFAAIRRFLSYLPQHVWALPPVLPCTDDRNRADARLADIVPADRRRVFDMRAVVRAVVDQESFFEIGRRYGSGQITGLARLLGCPVGVLANDCRQLAGSMTAAGARKVRRFVEFCQTFHLPVLNFVDEPGFMIGAEAEMEGTVRAGAGAVLAVAMATIPWASIMVRKSMGLGAAAHSAPGSYILAWPSAESGALPVEGGVAVAFGREIAAAADPAARRRELEAQFAARRSPFPRAEALSVHDLIDPRETRARLCDWIELAWPLLDQQLGPTSFTYRP